MKKILTLALISLTAQSFAQTKFISHKSHSGSEENLKLAIQNNLFNIGNSNFGLREMPKPKLDSVVFASNTMVILWSKGKDSMYQHSQFPRKHVVDSLKKLLKYDYTIYYTKFIGFDNSASRNIKKPSIIPVGTGDDNGKPPLGGKLFWLLGMITFSMLMGFIHYMFNKKDTYTLLHSRS